MSRGGNEKIRVFYHLLLRDLGIFFILPYASRLLTDDGGHCHQYINTLLPFYPLIENKGHDVSFQGKLGGSIVITTGNSRVKYHVLSIAKNEKEKKKKKREKKKPLNSVNCLLTGAV